MLMQLLILCISSFTFGDFGNFREHQCDQFTISSCTDIGDAIFENENVRFGLFFWHKDESY